MSSQLNYQDFEEITKPYREQWRENQILSFEDMIQVKRDYAERGGFLTLTPCAMGALVNCFFKSRSMASHEGDNRIRYKEAPYFGIIVDDTILIRWNKVDRWHLPSIQKRRSFTDFYYQSNEIEGMSKNTMSIWGGYIPDPSWSKVMHQYLSFFNGELQWYYDYQKQAVIQLRLDTDILSKRKTGTDNQ